MASCCLGILERRHGLTQTLAALVADPRDPAHITNTVEDILKGRMLAMACQAGPALARQRKTCLGFLLAHRFYQTPAKPAFGSMKVICLRIDFTKLRRKPAFGSMRLFAHHRENRKATFRE